MQQATRRKRKRSTRRTTSEGNQVFTFSYLGDSWRCVVSLGGRGTLVWSRPVRRDDRNCGIGLAFYTNNQAWKSGTLIFVITSSMTQVAISISRVVPYPERLLRTFKHTTYYITKPIRAWDLGGGYYIGRISYIHYLPHQAPWPSTLGRGTSQLLT